MHRRLCAPSICLTLSLCAAPALAQNALLFSGRFPFVSLDHVNERAGGSITRLSEFDFSLVTPGPGAFARSLQPATAHQAYLAGAAGTGNYTKFYQLKTYFQNFQLAAPFVRHADKAAISADKVFFTVRSDAPPLQLEVFTGGGSGTAVLAPGDFVRFLPNGNVDYFITAALFGKAAGAPPPNQSSVVGASALCQDAAGNLYYSPPTGGHWINNSASGPVYCNDGSIVMIDAADITYDARGDVQDVVADCAHVLFEETNGGPSANPRTVRSMAANAGAYDRLGGALVVAGVFGKVAGLDLDPNGGTTVASWPDRNNNFPTVPEFVFVSDAGAYAGTIFSTANSGSIASINGVLCGSNTPSVPATGSWLGVVLDVVNFQPSLMGLQVVAAPAYEPLVLDMPNEGALLDPVTQPAWQLDLHGQPFQVSLLAAAFGPGGAGGFAPSTPLAALPPLFGPGSHWQVFVLPNPVTLAYVVHDSFGYGTFSTPNPNQPALQGLTLLLQAAGLGSGPPQLSTPVLMQAK